MFIFSRRSASVLRHPPLVHLILILVALLLKELQPTTGQAPLITGACRSRCDENRPKGKEGDFNFNCEEVYTSEEDRQKCRDDCESCPKEVCDETATKKRGDWNSNEDGKPSANKWHCPDLNEICFNLCHENRPKGTRESYTLNCDTVYSTDSDRQKCKDKCSECPSYVCNGNQKNIFNCPYEKLDPKCEKQCDRVRGYGELGPIPFDCSQKYISPYDQYTCQNTCKKHCPAWVCDDSTGDHYNCPSIRIEKDCLDHCNQRRRSKGHGSEAFDLDCYYNYENRCDEGCGFCQFSSDNGKGPLCNPSDTDQFKCPVQDPEQKGTWTTASRTYKGVCKDRCEDSRGGGIDPFKLKCDRDGGTYSTQEERNACDNDCKQCNDHEFEYVGCSGETLNCQGTLQYRKEKAKKEKEDEDRKNKTEADTERHEKRLKAEQEKLDAHLNEELEFSRTFVIVILLGLIILCAGFAGALCWMLNRKSKKSNDKQGQDPQMQNNGVAVAQPVGTGAGMISGQQGFGGAQIQQEPYQKQQQGSPQSQAPGQQ